MHAVSADVVITTGNDNGKRKLASQNAPPNTPTGASGHGQCGPNKRRSGVSSHTDLPPMPESMPKGVSANSFSPICKPTPQSSGSTPAVATAPHSTPPTHAMTPSRRGRSAGLPPLNADAPLDQASTPSSTYKLGQRSVWETPSQQGVLALASKRVVDYQLAAATACKLSLPVEDDGLAHVAPSLAGVSPVRAPTPRTPKVSTMSLHMVTVMSYVIMLGCSVLESSVDVQCNCCMW